jgi:hypothetical protein
MTSFCSSPGVPPAAGGAELPYVAREASKGPRAANGSRLLAAEAARNEGSCGGASAPALMRCSALRSAGGGIAARKLPRRRGARAGRAALRRYSSTSQARERGLVSREAARRPTRRERYSAQVGPPALHAEPPLRTGGVTRGAACRAAAHASKATGLLVVLTAHTKASRHAAGASYVAPLLP